ncbi:MAG: mandelate racemase/muconate lactonizing enzyme family protein [Roseovarius sp.]|nr:mandelate racemase/muconate lactonizing enzyme family protein [Roseovarius sp.]
MKITSVKSSVLSYDLDEPLGYSQKYYTSRTAHIVEIETDEGLTGIGECFGPGPIALANKIIVERVLAPMLVGMDPLDREVFWHNAYNGMRDHGQKGMPIQALSGIDIALWDLAGKIHDLPLYKLLGGAFRNRLEVYGYGMMLQQVPDLADRFADESSAIMEMGFKSMKMKIGKGPDEDVKLVRAVRDSVGADVKLMVDANHAYTASEAVYLGRELENLGVYWFEEPVAPEDLAGYRDLCRTLDINISGGEAEYTRWGFRNLLEGRCVDILQPETCALGGISEYLKVRDMAHTHFIPVVNHVWGSAVCVAVNMHLLAAMPDLPGGAHPAQPMLEYDTTPNKFREDILLESLGILDQVKSNGGWVGLPSGPGLGIELDRKFMNRHKVKI